ncbi:MAG: hypothetical protein HOV79_05985 [Hamadaea sp.]|nr:hypothetical protein [Hamadaea sp.]
MRTARLLLAALALTGGLLIPAPAVRATPAVHAAQAQVTANPSTVLAGEPLTVTAGCGVDATGATLSGTSFGGPSQIPMQADTKSGPGAYAVDVTIPATTAPGTYQLSVTCSTGEGGTGKLVVAPGGAPGTGDGSTATERAVPGR